MKKYYVLVGNHKAAMRPQKKLSLFVSIIFNMLHNSTHETVYLYAQAGQYT